MSVVLHMFLAYAFGLIRNNFSFYSFVHFPIEIALFKIEYACDDKISNNAIRKVSDESAIILILKQLLK